MKLGNISKWKKLVSGKVIKLPSREGQRVKLAFNTACRTVLHLVTREATYLLAAVDGYKEIEFAFDGDAEIHADGEAWYYLPDHFGFSVISTEPTFTRIMERKARNPEMELILAKMMQNVDRRVEAVMAEKEKLAKRQVKNVNQSKGNPSVGKPDDEEPTAGDGPSGNDQPVKTEQGEGDPNGA